MCASELSVQVCVYLHMSVHVHSHCVHICESRCVMDVTACLSVSVCMNVSTHSCVHVYAQVPRA